MITNNKLTFKKPPKKRKISAIKLSMLLHLFSAFSPL
jgi:hypothetical protein